MPAMDWWLGAHSSSSEAQAHFPFEIGYEPVASARKQSSIEGAGAPLPAGHVAVVERRWRVDGSHVDGCGARDVDEAAEGQHGEGDQGGKEGAFHEISPSTLLR